MTGARNEKREREIAELFVRLVGRDLKIVAFGDKPDVEVQDAETGQSYGLEICELLPRRDGRVRAIEERLCRQLTEACKEKFGPGGDIEIRVERDPESEREVDAWMAAFRALARVDSRGLIQFPSRELGHPSVVEVREAWQAYQDRWKRHGWMIVEVLPNVVHQEWMCRAVGRSETHFPFRLGQIDDLVVEAIRGKCELTSGYRFQGRLWLCLRNVWIAKPSTQIVERVRQIDGVDRFAAIGLLQLPHGVLDPLTPPSVHCLFGQFGRELDADDSQGQSKVPPS